MSLYQQPVYLTVRQLSEKHPAFTQGTLRSLIFNRDTNGFANCMRRIGRKILISEQEFILWVERGGCDVA